MLLATYLNMPSIDLLAHKFKPCKFGISFAFEGGDILLDADRIDVLVAQFLCVESVRKILSPL